MLSSNPIAALSHLYGLLAMGQQHRDCVLSPEPRPERHGGPSSRLLTLAEHDDASWSNILALPAQHPHHFCYLLSAIHHMLQSIAISAPS